MKRILPIFLGCLLFMCIPSLYAQNQVKHVVVVGFDGLGAYAVPKANMPHLKKLMEDGAFSLRARTVLPSSSAVNWASMIMGASPTMHGYTEWGSKTTEIPSVVVNENGMFPSIFSVIKKNNPAAKVAAVYSWEGISYLLEKPIMDIDIAIKGNEDETVAQAIKVIQTEKPDFLFVHFDQPDGAGHAFGHDSPEYYKELEKVDARLGAVEKAVRDAGIEKETLFIEEGQPFSYLLSLNTRIFVVSMNINNPNRANMPKE